MYQHSYAEVLSDSLVDARAIERQALDEAVSQLHRAAAAGPGSAAAQAALDFTRRLWALLISDLASPGNDLPGALRASLMSVGLGILAEAQRIELGLSHDFAGLADICGIVRDGLT
jgi:flagellar protein FlaF